jgi:hypothetical protein
MIGSKRPPKKDVPNEPAEVEWGLADNEEDDLVSATVARCLWWLDHYISRLAP